MTVGPVPAVGATLASVLEPTSVGEFLAETWERRPAVYHRHRDDVPPILTTLDVDRLISAGIVDQQDGRAVRAGRVDPHTPLFHGDGRANIAAFGEAYAGGCTIVVNNVHQRHPGMAALARDIEIAVGQPVGANVYLSPPRAQGLAPHFDNHDVLVVQCEGRKTWKVFDPLVELPLPDQHFDVREEQLGPPIAEYVLEPGDVLYLPRGYVHVAMTDDLRSLHVTFGMSAYRLYDVLAKALFLLACRDVEFRKATPTSLLGPPGTGGEPPAALVELVGRFASSVDLGAAMDEVRADLLARLHPLPDWTIGGLDAIDAVEGDTPVRRRAGAVCSVVEVGDVAILQFPGNAISAPLAAGPGLRFIAATDRFHADELPDSLTPQAKIVLTRRLVMAGLLVPEPPSEEHPHLLHVLPAPHPHEDVADAGPQVPLAQNGRQGPDVVDGDGPDLDRVGPDGGGAPGQATAGEHLRGSV